MLDGVNFRGDYNLLSYDVVALYPSIPVKKALELALAKLKKDRTLQERTKWSPEQIVFLSEICLETHYRDLDGVIWTQTDGTRIGKSISGPLAGIYMEYLEEEFVLKRDKMRIKSPLFWKRIRDDVFCVWQHGIEKANQYLTYLNSIEPRVQWTNEIEDENGSIPFMDMQITRCSEGFQTKVYRKPTHTNSYSKFRSNRPERTHLNGIKGLLFRAHKICSPADLQDELELISNTFIANGYPPHKVDSVINSYKPKDEANTNEVTEEKDDGEVNTLCVPYVKGVSERLENALKKERVRLIYKKGRTVGAIICNVKTTRRDRKNVVYKGRCKTCGLVYVGETSQWLETRKDQHMRCCRTKDEKNAFALHLKQFPNHEIDWENFEVLDSARNWKERKIKESIYIQRASNGGNLRTVLNIENGEAMDTCWTSILFLIK